MGRYCQDRPTLNRSELLKSRVGKCRALGIDYGDKRIGIAVSDIGWNISSPLKVLDNHGAYQKLFQLVDEYMVGVIVIGMPVSLKGQVEGEQVIKVKKFAGKLGDLLEDRSKNIELIGWDERMSSNAAHGILSECGASTTYRKHNIDKIAASFILQGFLDFMRNHTAEL
jgi:putative Holliday junction resolvase